MRFPMPFRRENSSAARRERENQLHKALVDGLRTLGSLFTHAAELVEKRRLERQGFERQEHFLERTVPRRTPSNDPAKGK